jgi:cytochrome P450
MSASLDELRDHFDHTTARGDTQTLARYGSLRRSCPVTYSDRHNGFWAISRYQDIIEVLRKNKVFSSAGGIIIPGMANPLRMIPTESDEPLHTEYRSVLYPFLTPGAVKPYEPMVRRCVTDLIDGFIDDGEADVLVQFAKPLPAQVISQFFGFTAEDGIRCYEWLCQMFMGDEEAAVDGVTKFVGFLGEALDKARANPVDDVLSAVVTHRFDGRGFSDEECVGIMFTSITGALETTVAGIALGLRIFGLNRGVRDRLLAEPASIARAVEEVLRMESPAQCPARTVTEEVEVNGMKMKPGDRVLLLFGSGNYDDDKFSTPEEFQIDRRPNSHLAFGHGIHKCVGQHLARLELRVAFEEVLRRMPDYELIEAPTPNLRGGSTWGIDALRVRFTPGRRMANAD